MEFKSQTNTIVKKDWLGYHPYDDTTYVDNYYMTLCNKVLITIRKSEIASFLNHPEEAKSLACVLVAYFEDVISETRLFSTFTRQHKKMYGKELPFYEISDDYFDDDLNLQDIYFLIWYHIAVLEKKCVLDPYFENNPDFNEAVLKIYTIFDREYENAPQNEKLQQFLQLTSSDVNTVRGKFSFIVEKSFLWKYPFEIYFTDILAKYMVNGKIVLKEHDDVMIYDQQINFMFNECMPLLSMRTNEYFAELIGEEHSEYQAIKNISKRIAGSFLLKKIEKNGFLIEHLSSKKQLWLSNEYTSFQDDTLIENKTVLTLGLVQWSDNVWQNQGGCIVSTIQEIKEKKFAERLFDDENMKMQVVGNLGKAFLELTQGKHIAYMRGIREYAEFTTKLYRKYTKIHDPKITEKKLDTMYKGSIEHIEKKMPFEKDEVIGVFYNPQRGIETYGESVISCMPDKNNSYYAGEEFDVSDLLINNTFSKEFVDFVIENNIIKLGVDEYENPNMFKIIMENRDFLLRFYRMSGYFSKPGVTLN